MEEIREGAWSTTQISKIVNDGYLLEYKDELTKLGYYVPATIQANPQSNDSQVSDTGTNYSAVFNAEYYMNKYPDLKANIGNNAAALLNHFITVGMAEGRQGSEEFKLEAYKKNNADLVAVFGNDNASYYTHYITSGKAEKRIAK